MPRLSLALVSLIVLTLAGEARAESAAEFFKQARVRYAAGKFGEAAALFERADELEPHAAVVFNAATAWDQAGNLPRAADDYARALAGDLDDASRKRAKTRSKELEGELGVLEIAAPKGSELTVDGRTRHEFPARFHVAPGKLTVSFKLPGGAPDTRTADVAAGAVVSLDLAPPAATPAPPPPEPPISRESSSDPRWPIAGWVAVGVSAGLAATSAILWSKAKDERDSLVAGDADARGRAQTLETWTNVTLVSSVLLGAAGITVLVIKPGKSKEANTLTLRVGREVSFAGRF
jgi:tetratricopeptide (TPR) repeat protein